MPKVCFLNPPFFNKFSRESRSPAVSKSGTLYYPKWLCYSAAYARKKGHIIDVIDAPAKGHSLDYVIDRIKDFGASYLVVDTSTPSILNDIEVVKAINTVFGSSLNIIMVGRHVSALPSETYKFIDFPITLALKEYELTVVDWIETLEANRSLSSVKGIAYSDGSSPHLTINEERESLKDLDELPFVTPIYKEFLDINDYFYGHSLHPLVVFDTSRGCPFKCSFCVYPQTFSGHEMRYRSPKNVAAEFAYVKENFPTVKTIMLEDDTFPVDRARTSLVCDELIAINNKIPFDSNARADNITFDDERIMPFTEVKTSRCTTILCWY